MKSLLLTVLLTLLVSPIPAASAQQPAVPTPPDVESQLAALEELGSHVNRDAQGKLVSIIIESPEFKESSLHLLEGINELPSLTIVNDDLTGTKIAAHINSLRGLRSLRLSGRSIDDGGVQAISHLSNLTGLTLVGPKITNAGLKEISRMKKLQELCIVDTQITDEGLKHMSELKSLKYLIISSSRITDQGLPQLHQLTNLKRLQLLNTHISWDAVKVFKMSVPGCGVIRSPPRKSRTKTD